jgi:hypothetical protein
MLAENMASLRRVALNLLSKEQLHQIILRHKRPLYGLDESYLLTVISGAT